MPGVCSSNVNDDSDELVFVALILVESDVILECMFFFNSLFLLFFSETFVLVFAFRLASVLLLLFVWGSLLSSKVFSGELAFGFHDVIETERSQVQCIWELEEGIDLLILESVEIEHDSLQLHHKHIRCLREQGPLGDVNFLLAARALVVRDDFTFKVLPETLLDALAFFDREGQVVEVLKSVPDEAALFADHLRAVLASEHRLQQVLLRSRLDQILDSVKNDVEELFSIVLYRRIRRASVHLLEREAELNWVVIDSL
mmetsp:Transcript_42019/g.48695  ORF Transcript_42019/g.48695 Transcript_42019/m.48695 type:complete len:258 (+) Transcript_42019:597-1370(+)